jgi:hypothetical protein
VHKDICIGSFNGLTPCKEESNAFINNKLGVLRIIFIFNQNGEEVRTCCYGVLSSFLNQIFTELSGSFNISYHFFVLFCVIEKHQEWYCTDFISSRSEH